MLTPIDIHNRQLKPAKIGGYDKKDIDDFMEEIIASYEELYNENRVLKEKITSLSEGIQYYKKMEGTLQKALLLAEKTSSETQEAAKSQADSVLTEASAKAEALTRETKAEIDALRAEAQAQAEVTRAKANRELEETRNHVRKLVQSYENYRLQFKKLAEAQIEMLESDSFSIFVPELDELMKDAPSADNILDNQGVIPINIGSPAPFEEPPSENASGADTASAPKQTSKQPPKASVKPEAEAPKKLDVTFDDLSNSIAIPISSNMGPFTDLPAEDDSETSPASVLQDLKIDSSTAPSIDINIGTAIGEEIEVSMSLDSPSDQDVGTDTIDILVNTESLLNNAVEGLQTDDTVAQPETKPVVEQVDISESSPSEEAAAQAVDIPVSTGSSYADPDVIELATGIETAMAGIPEQKEAALGTDSGVIELASGVEQGISPVSQSMEPPIESPVPEEPVSVPLFDSPVITEPETEQAKASAESSDNSIFVDFGMPDAIAEPQETNIPLNVETPANAIAEPQGTNIPLNVETPANAIAEPQGTDIPLNVETPANAIAEPQGTNIPLNVETPANAIAEPQGTDIPLSFGTPADVTAEPQGMNIPLSFETPADVTAEPQGMNIPLSFETPADVTAEPQGMNIPLSFETPADVTAEPQGMNIPLSFETPVDIAAEPQGMNIPISFETPDDLQSTDPQASSIPIGFEMPEDLQATDPQNMSIPIGFETPEDLQAAAPQNVDLPLNMEMQQNPVESVPVMPVMDVPAMETPMAEMTQPSTNGLIGLEPSAPEPDANSMTDVSNFLDSPIHEIPEELQTAASNELTNPAPADNGIISDAFLDPSAMFESPISEEPVEQQEKQPTNANDAMLNINPFNFIDPE